MGVRLVVPLKSPVSSWLRHRLYFPLHAGPFADLVRALVEATTKKKTKAKPPRALIPSD